MKDLLSLATQRRSIYHLGKNITLPKQEIIELIENITKQTPSAFNSQSSRVVVLLEKEHDTLWNIVEEALKEIVPAEHFSQTKEKIASFRAGYGSILYFEDEVIVQNLQQKFATYAHNFPRWSEHAHGITLYAVWMALAEINIGASLQHYNELIEEKVKAHWSLPSTWSLKAQMPFGSIESPATTKEFIPTETRFKVFG